jgi:hypothetical protein
MRGTSVQGGNDKTAEGGCSKEIFSSPYTDTEAPGEARDFFFFFRIFLGACATDAFASDPAKYTPIGLV